MIHKMLIVFLLYLYQIAYAALSQNKPALGVLKSTGTALIDRSKDDKDFVEDVSGKLDGVTDNYILLEEKLRDRMKRIQEALFKYQGFDECLDDYEKWLSEMERKLKSAGMLSIKPAVIRKQKAEQKVGRNAWRGFRCLVTTKA